MRRPSAGLPLFAISALTRSAAASVMVIAWGRAVAMMVFSLNLHPKEYVGSGSEHVQFDLGDLGHHAGVPGWVPDQLYPDGLDVLDALQHRLDLSRHLAGDGTGRGGQGHIDDDVAV